jgi:prevent-host-death family protein
MATQPRHVETVDAEEAQQRWTGLLDRVQQSKDRVIVERDGVPVAAIISAADLQRLNRLEAERDRDFAIVAEVRKVFEDVPFEELEREAAKALAEVRAEMRAERGNASSAAE